MSAALNLSKNMRATVIAFIVNIALLFFSYRLVVMGGGLEALGLWSTLMAWIFLIRMGDIGMTSATVRYASRLELSEHGPDIRRYIDTGLGMNGALFLALSVVGYLAFSVKIGSLVPGDATAQAKAAAILPIMFVSFFLTNISGLVLSGLRAIHLGYMSAWLTVSGSLVQLVLVVGLVPQVGLLGLALGQLGQHMLMILIGWPLFLYQLKKASGYRGPLLPSLMDMATLREMLGFSIQAQFANVTSGLFEPLSKILLGRFAGLEAVGLYEMAFKMVSMPRNSVVSGVHATVPAITRLLESDLPESRRTFDRVEKVIMRSSAAILGAVILASPLVSWLWLGRIDPMLSIFVAIIAAGFLGNTYGAPAYALGMAAGKLRYNILSGLLSLVLLVGLMTAAGFLGEETLMIVGMAIALAIGGIYVRRANHALLNGPT